MGDVSYSGVMPLADAAATERLESRRRLAVVVSEFGIRFGDLLAVILAGFAVHAMFGAPDQAMLAAIGAYALAGVVTNLTFTARAAYRYNATYLTRLCAGRVLMDWCHAFGFWLIAMIVIHGLVSAVDRDHAQLITWLRPDALIAFLAAGMACILIGRLLIMAFSAIFAIGHAVRLRTYIVGTPDTVRTLAETIATRSNPTMDVRGFFVDGSGGAASASGLSARGLPALGSVDRLLAMVERGTVDMVLMALPPTEVTRTEAIIRRIARYPVSVGLVPDLTTYRVPHRVVHTPDGLALLQVCEARFSVWARCVKRLQDMILAPLLLLLLAPVMAVIAIAIRLDSPGPILFSQRRYGMGNKTFDVHKFRTMYVDATDHDCERQTSRGDPRVTRVGAILRRFSLDELPQLFNVLRGDMSIVGPRPHAVSTKAEGQLFEEAVATYMARHHVKPGITGWAQVNGWRGETDSLIKITKRVEHDLYYIGNWSLMLDLSILLRTAAAVFKGDNAY